MPQLNPRWLITQAPGDLKAQIQKAVSVGYHVTSQTSTTAQLMRQKHFSCLIAMLCLVLGFGFGLLIYIFYYLAKKDDAIYLDIESQPTGEELKKEIEAFNNRPWYKKHPVLAVFLALTVNAIVVGTLGNIFLSDSDATRTEAQEIKQVFDVPSLFGKSLSELKATLGTPRSETQPLKVQIQNGTTAQEYISWEKDGVELIVTYEYKTKKIVDFFVGPTDQSGGTKDKSFLLGIGSLKEEDPRYTVKFVEVQKPEMRGQYAGVIVTSR